mmetsp:Transcript_8287/g.9392  ORF Transcript_8287/g.9392 Transcript_8287/m.9392 type:complete len:290 (-) Transcript_8287:37-906(-)
MSAQQSNKYHMMQYGKPELLCSREYKDRSRISNKNLQSQISISVDKRFAPSSQVIAFESNSNRKVISKLLDKRDQKNSNFKTESNFFKKVSPMNKAKNTCPLPLKPNTQGVREWMKGVGLKSISTNISINDGAIDCRRVQTVSTPFTSQSKPYQMRSITSNSSMMKGTTQTMSQAGSKFSSTPFQMYKIKNKSKRKIFTSQMVPSKNKIFRIAKREQRVLDCPSRNTNEYKRSNLEINPEENFIEMLGAIDSNLKNQTLLQFNRINEIRGARNTQSQMVSRANVQSSPH